MIKETGWHMDSCGIVMSNTIAHAIQGTPLWEQQWSDCERIQWLLHLASKVEAEDVQQATPNDTHQVSIDMVLNDEANIGVAIGNHNFSDLQDFTLENSAKDTLEGHSLAEAIRQSSQPSLMDLLNPCPNVFEANESGYKAMSDGTLNLSHSDIFHAWEQVSDVDSEPPALILQPESDVSST